MARFIRFWLPFTIFLITTFVLSGMSSPAIPFNLDSNSLHLPEFALFSFLLIRAIHGGRPGRPSISAALGTLVLSGLWGVSDEIHQAFIPGRVPDINDLARDLIGSVIGLAAFYLYSVILGRTKATGSR